MPNKDKFIKRLSRINMATFDDDFVENLIATAKAVLKKETKLTKEEKNLIKQAARLRMDAFTDDEIEELLVKAKALESTKKDPVEKKIKRLAKAVAKPKAPDFSRYIKKLKKKS